MALSLEELRKVSAQKAKEQDQEKAALTQRVATKAGAGEITAPAPAASAQVTQFQPVNNPVKPTPMRSPVDNSRSLPSSYNQELNADPVRKEYEKSYTAVKNEEYKLGQAEKNLKTTQQKETELQKQVSAIQTAQRGMETLAKEYEATGDDVAFQAYMIAYNEYNGLVATYKKDYGEYQKTGQKAYDAYNNAVMGYQKAWSEYETANQSYLNAHPEVKYADLSIEEAQKQIEQLQTERKKIYNDTIGAGGNFADYEKNAEKQIRDIKVLEDLITEKKMLAAQSPEKVWGSSGDFWDRLDLAKQAGMLAYEAGAEQLGYKIGRIPYAIAGGILKAVGSVTGNEKTKEKGNQWLNASQEKSETVEKWMAESRRLMADALYGTGSLDGFIIEQMQSITGMMYDIWLTGGATQLTGNVMTSGVQMPGLEKTIGGKYALTTKSVGGGMALTTTKTMAIRAAGSGMVEAEEKGYSLGNQILVGGAAGALEYAAETMFGGNPIYDENTGWLTDAMGKVIKNPKVMKIMYSKGFDIFSEGFEEVFTALAQPIAESAITWTNPQMPTAEEVAEAFAGGIFLSVLGQGASVVATEVSGQGHRIRKAGRVISQADAVRELVNEGLDADRRTEAYDLAQKMQKKLDAGKTPTAGEIGKLMFANQDAIDRGLLVDSEMEPDQSAPEGALHDPENGFYAIRTSEENGKPVYQIVKVNADGTTEKIGEAVDDLLTVKWMAESRGLNIRNIGKDEVLRDTTEATERNARLTEQEEAGEPLTQRVETEQPGIHWAGNQPEAVTEAVTEPVTQEVQAETPGLTWAGQENMEGAVIDETAAQTDRDDRSTTRNADYADGNIGETGSDGSRGSAARLTQERALARGYAARRYRSAVKDLGVKLVDIREVIPNGVEGYQVQVVPESAYDDEAKRAKEAAADKGLDLVLVVGSIPVTIENKEKYILGMIDFDSGKIYVRADSAKQSVLETVNHELFHDAAERDETLAPRLIDFVKKHYTYEEYENIVSKYYQDYRDMYPHLEGETLKEAIWEELLADAYAEYNRYGKENLPGLSEEVQKLTWAGKEKTTARTDGGVKFSVEIAQDGEEITVVNTGQKRFNNADPKQYAAIARKVLLKKFRNKVLPLGKMDLARITSDKIDEYAYPRKRYETDSLEYNAKMRASAELDNLLKTAEYLTWDHDHTGHKEAELGFDYYKVKFIVDGHLFEGIVNIANSMKGRILYDITKIKEISDTTGKYATLLAQSTSGFGNLSDATRELSRGVTVSGSLAKTTSVASKNSIKKADDVVKQKFSAASEGTEKRTAESMRDELLEVMPSFSHTPHSVPRNGRKESKLAEKLTDEERAVVEQAMEKREKTEKKSIFDMTIEEMLIPKEGFTSTPAIDKLGVKVAGSVARYRSTEDLKAYVRAATLADKYLRNAVERLKPTDKEIEVAKQLVDGPLETIDLNPKTVDIQKVTEIADFYAAKKSYWEDSLSQRKDEIRVMLQRIAQELFGDSDKYAPNLKTLPVLTKIVMNYKETERLMRKIFGNEQGQKIYDTVFYPVWINSVEAKRWQGSMLEKVQKFTDKDGKERALTLEEREFAQRIMEGQAVIEELQKLREGTRSKIANAARALNEDKNLSEVSEEFELDQGYQQGLAQQYADYLSMVEITRNMDMTIMGNAIKVYRQIYNDLYDAINDFLVSHGKPPIGFIKNYAPHFQKHEVQNALFNALSSMGLSQANVSQLPTDIAGRTADYKPIQKWNPHFHQRKGHKTDYDIQVGFERYIDYAAEVFFHTDDIMRVREIVNYYRSQYAGEAISDAIQNAQIDRYKDTEWKIEFLKKQGAIDPLKKTDDMSPKEVNEKYEAYISELYKQAEPKNLTKYSNFVTWLDDYANTLAGKQSWMDRGFEAFAGRDALNKSQQIVNAFAKANVAGNLSSVFNQFAQVPILQRDLGIYYELALIDIVILKTRREGFSKLSDLLTDRRGVEGLAEMPTGKLVSWLFKPAELTDTLVATIAVRGKYRQLLAQNKGMTPEQALKEADNYGRRVMGSRAKGAKPLAFNNKNFLAAQFNMYQLEALNTLEYMRAEWPRQFRETAKQRGIPYAVAREAVKALLFMLSTFVINRLAEDNYGGTPAPMDILGWVLTSVSGAYDEDEEEFMQTLLDNILEKSSGERPFGTKPLETPEEGVSGLDWAGAWDDLKYNLLDEIPVVRNITQTLGMGDQTGAMAGVGEVFRSLKAGFTTLKDQLLRGADETGLDWAGAGWKAAGEFGSGATIFLPGGRQLKKTARGAMALIRGGMYSGYGENKKLQYPVEATTGNIIRGLMFGPSGFRETDEYYLNGKTLSASQTQKAEALEDYNVDIQQTYELYQEYFDINENEDKELLTSIEAKAEKRNAIANMDLNAWQKLEVYLQTLYTGNDKGREKARAKYEALIGENVTWQQLTDLDNDYAALNEDSDGDGEADMDSLERGIAKRNTIAMMDLTDQQKLEVYDRYHLDRSDDNYEETRKEFEAMLNAGLSWEEITAAHNTYAMLNADKDLTAIQKATEYALWADQQGWNKRQTDAVKERYMFWQMIPATASKYEKFTEQGWSSAEAQRLTEAQSKINDMGLTADKDANGKTVPGSKKKKVVQAIARMNIPDELKDALYLSYNYSAETLDETPWH